MTRRESEQELNKIPIEVSAKATTVNSGCLIAEPKINNPSLQDDNKLFRIWPLTLKALNEARGTVNDISINNIGVSDATLSWLCTNEIKSLGDLADLNIQQLKGTFIYDRFLLRNLVETLTVERVSELISLENNENNTNVSEQTSLLVCAEDILEIKLIVTDVIRIKISTNLFSIVSILDEIIKEIEALGLVFESLEKEKNIYLFTKLSSKCQNPSIPDFYKKHTDCNKVTLSNTYEELTLKFVNSDEYAVFEIYERVRYTLMNIDYAKSNRLLVELKNKIKRIDPKLHSAKLKRLLKDESGIIDKFGFNDLVDILSLPRWDISFREASVIYNTLIFNVEKLIMPIAVIDYFGKTILPRERIVLKNKFAEKSKTLEALGQKYGVTRERIRQILKNAVLKLNLYNKINNIITTLKSVSECEYCIRFSELAELGLQADGLSFLIDEVFTSNCMYRDTESQLFVFNRLCPEWLKELKQASAKLRKTFTNEEYDNIIVSLQQTYKAKGINLTYEVIKQVLFSDYEVRGKLLVKRNVFLGDVYQAVLERYFPEGISVYKTAELERFRDYYRILFEDNEFNQSDRALISIITNICTLVGRGRYKLNKQIVLPNELKDEIYAYIMNYPYDMVMSNAIMHQFKYKLEEIGVGNKYILISALKQNFDTEFEYRRDYVIKGEGGMTGSFYSIVSEFVKAHKYGVSFDALKKEFGGVSESVLYFALSDEACIIPMYNKMYIHIDNIYFHEKDAVFDYLNRILGNKKFISIAQIFTLFKRDFKDFIANNNISTSWYLFSILRAFYSEDFKFSRPHIIDIDVDSANGRELMRQAFWNKDEVKIEDIKKFAKDKDIYIYDFLELLNSYNDKFLIYDKETIMCADRLGITDEIALNLEDDLAAALGDKEFMEIDALNIYSRLPLIANKWTSWLVYSVIFKHGTRLAVTTSNARFNNAVPIVYRSDINVEIIREHYSERELFSKGTYTPDDLSDLDSLVEEIIVEETLYN